MMPWASSLRDGVTVQDDRRLESAPRWICSSTRESSCSPATASRCPPGARAHRRRGGRCRRRDRLPVRDQGTGADRRPRQAGGIKIANNRDEAREHAERDPRHGHPRPDRPRAVGRGRLGDRVRVLRLGRLRPLGQGAAGDALDQGRDGHRGGGRRGPGRDRARCTSIRCSASRTSTAAGSRSRRASTPTSCARSARCSRKLYDAFVAEEATLVEVNPLIVTPERDGQGARREGHARRQLALPPPRQRRAARPLGRGPAGADGQGARADLRQARRQHRHPRQRRRAGDVDARRRRPGRRRAGELPRRRRRLEGGGDHERGRGDPLRPERQGGAVQHLRRHHALRRGRARA